LKTLKSVILIALISALAWCLVLAVACGDDDDDDDDDDDNSGGGGNDDDDGANCREICGSAEDNRENYCGPQDDNGNHCPETHLFPWNSDENCPDGDEMSALWEARADDENNPWCLSMGLGLGTARACGILADGSCGCIPTEEIRAYYGCDPK